MKQEDIRKIWEWCGFKLYNPKGLNHNLPNDWCRFPNDVPFDEDGTRQVCGHLPDLTLDNMFEYAIPKLRELGCRFNLNSARDRFIVRVYGKPYD